MSTAASPKARPFAKWAGGKRQLLPEIRKYVPQKFKRYFEPFVGGGAVFFDLQPSKAVLSDSNERLIRTYRAIRDDVEHVIRLLAKCPHDKGFYEDAVKLDADKLTDAQLAAWFIYTNKTGFNGLYRVNRSNKFNVPFGKYENPCICDADNLRACSKALQGVDLKHGDFSTVLSKAKPGDFVYIDPPYIPLNETSSFTAYQAGGFGKDEQMRLCGLAEDLVDKGAHVLLSGSCAPFTRELYDTPRFKIHEVKAKRSINSKVAGRGEVAELLIVGRQSK